MRDDEKNKEMTKKKKRFEGKFFLKDKGDGR